jgi:hypothetical protein
MTVAYSVAYFDGFYKFLVLQVVESEFETYPEAGRTQRMAPKSHCGSSTS